MPTSATQPPAAATPTAVHRRIATRSASTDSPLADVAIVIPVAAGDDSWRSLLADLRGVSPNSQVLLVGADQQPDDLPPQPGRAELPRLPCHVSWLVDSGGRACQMNRGATHSTRPFLWFLHADSRLSAGVIAALDRSLQTHTDAIHYFDLAFQHDGPRWCRLNALGARFRSRWLGMPFGDQGLCLSRELFDHLGRFDEAAPYGEDHLLVWAARRAAVPLVPVGATIATSARRYRAEGWLRVTLRHAWLTWRQAAPQAYQLLRSRVR